MAARSAISPIGALHMAFAGGDVQRVLDNHHKRITHVHTKHIQRTVVDALDRARESFLDALVKGAFTVPGDGPLDCEAIVRACAHHGYEGWFVVEAERDLKVSPPVEMAKRATRNCCVSWQPRDIRSSDPKIR
jgi:inosose dehydratase